MFDIEPQERQILEDIERRTGLLFRRVGGIDTRDSTIAKATLPVLAEWVDRLTEPSYRRTIYHRFHTPFAADYFEEIISWWQKETDQIALGFLTQNIAFIVSCDKAGQVWQLVKDLPQREFHYLLLSKIANCPAVGEEVKGVLLRDLRTGSLTIGDKLFIAEVKDDRIRKWFGGQINSLDPQLRRIAKKFASSAAQWPRGVKYATNLPDRSGELFSTEEDLEKLPALLDRLRKDFGLKISGSLKAARFLETAEVNRWIVVPVPTRDGPRMLWFRLEDTDVAEVLLADTATESKTVN